MKYNWQNPKWPQFTYNTLKIQDILYQFALEAASLSGKVQELPSAERIGIFIDLMVSEALRSSEIEGENFLPENIRSSIKVALGLAKQPKKVVDQAAAGVGKLMVQIQRTFEEPLTEGMLFSWHQMLMSGSYIEKQGKTGKWRTGKEPMLIVSGAAGRETIHFEAPQSKDVPQEMKRFIKWFNDTSPQIKGVTIAGPIRAAIAHIYFESIHPFEDGNGRIGRAISDKALSQELQHPILLSLSSVIQKNKKEYYHQLSLASSSNLDITEWIEYYVKIVYQAQLDAKKQISATLQKVKFWKETQDILNERQEKVLKKILDLGDKEFEGGLTAKKYMSMTGCSKATATRDLMDLLEKNILIKMEGSGRNTHYKMALMLDFSK